MDLGTCPRCGADWLVGSEVCARCGFVAIGAGLRALSQAAQEAERRKKAPHRRLKLPDVEISLFNEYERPTTVGYTLSVLAFIALAAGLQFRPWRNDFESLRVATGDPPSQSLNGVWQIDYNGPTGGGHYPMEWQLSGYMGFDEYNQVHILFQRNRRSVNAVGKYVEVGNRLTLKNFRFIGEASQLPDTIKIDLQWRSPTSVVADVSKRELLVLSRTDYDPFDPDNSRG